MDGYASTVSPLIVEGFKMTYEAVYPKAIIADTNILKEAPLEMIHAGFGDILGKYTSLTDWKLSKIINNEYYCQTTVNLVEKAREKCVENAERIKNRDEKIIRQLTEALIVSGIAIGFIGYSRPASGGRTSFSTLLGNCSFAKQSISSIAWKFCWSSYPCCFHDIPINER